MEGGLEAPPNSDSLEIWHKDCLSLGLEAVLQNEMKNLGEK